MAFKFLIKMEIFNIKYNLAKMYSNFKKVSPKAEKLLLLLSYISKASIPVAITLL